jgi:rod shape-determining protein MreD
MRRSARLGVLVVTCVIVQVAVFPHLRVAGVVPDLGLVLVAAIAFYDGSESAAIAGFAAGLGYDLFLETPLGLNALSYALTGYGIGVLQSSLLRAPRWIAPVLGLAAGLVGGAIFVGSAALAGVEEVVHDDTLRIVVLSALYDGVLALAVFPLVRRMLRGGPDRVPAWPLR